MKTILFPILFISLAGKGQFNDSAFYSTLSASFQAQITRYTERELDVYIDKGFFYPDSGYIERFLLLTIDSAGKKINKWRFVDIDSRIDTIGMNQKWINDIVVYWKDMFTTPVKYDSFTFVQPILYRTLGLKPYSISKLPIVCLDSSSCNFKPLILLPQINIWVDKPRY